MKYMKKSNYFGFLLLLSSGVSFSATAADVVILMSNPQPTCNVSVKPAQDLGELVAGDRRHTAFPITIACSGTIKSALTAQNLSGALQVDEYRVSVPMNTVGAGNGPFLWLQDELGNNLKLTGKASDSFCTETKSNRTCNVTPWTSTNADSGWGDGAVTMRFEIIYPA